METRRCSLASLVLRLALGFGMAFHGYPKLFDAAQRQGFIDGLFAMGVPMPALTGWGIALLEFVGGLLILLGAMTVLLSTLFVVEMIVAAVLVHLPHGFAAGNVIGVDEQGAPIFGMPGYEVNVLYLAGFLALVLLGAGRYSLAGLLHGGPREREDQSGGAVPRNPFARRGPTWRRRSARRDAERPD
jgi:putative oxidoreductase